jgi:5-methylcytosine-specific restriction endonuclease McrA
MADLDDLSQRAARLEEESYRELWPVVVEASTVIQEIYPSQRRAWPARLVPELREEQDDLCALCGEPLGSQEVHVDHRIPHSYGGGNERSNLQVTHASCNLGKRNAVDARDLLRYLEHRYLDRP